MLSSLHKRMKLNLVFLIYKERDQPSSSTPIYEDPPQVELTKKMFLGSLDVAGIHNKGLTHPRPTFREDVELSTIIQYPACDLRFKSE